MNEHCKILVIDDEKVIIKSADRILSEEGFSVVTAETAEDALLLMQSESPDIVLSDLKLPGMSGIDFMKNIRHQFPDVIVIITTGYSSRDIAISSLVNGAFDYLPKPFTIDELLGPVHRAARYLDIRNKDPFASSETDLTHYRFLGLQSWMKVEADGTALLGLTDVFQQTIGTIEQIDLPAVQSQLHQGRRLALLTSDDTLVHIAMSALGGRVIEINQSLEQRPQLLHELPFTEGWLARILPAELEQEIIHLREQQASD